MNTEPFTPYPCPLGEVIDHQADPAAYIIRTPSGQVRGIAANGECSPANVEADIANPPQVLATAADIAAHRWNIENGGVAVEVSSGLHRFDTTRENRSMWLAIQLKAQANPALEQGWKTLDHGFVLLTAADIIAVTTAVYAHVAQCFAAEALLSSGAPPTLAELPAYFAAAME